MIKTSKWTEITATLREIEEAADYIEGFELEPEAQDEQLAIIKDAAQKVRGLVHEILRPDLEVGK
jgi:hypothetical protein